MAQSSVSTFADPYSLQAAARNGEYDFLVKERGNFSVDLTKIDLNRLWIQQTRINLPFLLRVVPSSERVSVNFLLAGEHPSILKNNTEFTAQQICLYRGEMAHFQTQGSSWVSGMSLRVDLVSDIHIAIGDKLHTTECRAIRAFAPASPEGREACDVRSRSALGSCHSNSV